MLVSAAVRVTLKKGQGEGAYDKGWGWSEHMGFVDVLSKVLNLPLEAAPGKLGHPTFQCLWLLQHTLTL